MTDPAENRWPGERLGLPEAGPRSIARFGRRLGAIAIDWAVAYALAWLFFRDAHGTVDGLIILAVFAVLTILFLLVLNGSLGQIILRMRVVPARGSMRSARSSSTSERFTLNAGTTRNS